MATDNTTISLKVDPEFKRELEEFAEKEDLDISKLLRKAAKSYMNNQSPINKKSAIRKAG